METGANMAIKSTTTASGVLVAVFLAMNAMAEPFTFSGKGLYGRMSGVSGDRKLFMNISAIESTTRGTFVNNLSNPAGANFSGNYFTESECWYGFGFSNNIQYDTDDSILNQITISGEISVTWVEYCTGSNAKFTETLAFNGKMTTVHGPANRKWGTNYSEYGKNIKVNEHYNNTDIPATISDSLISSPAFGSVIPDVGYIGQSKMNYLEVTQ